MENGIVGEDPSCNLARSSKDLNTTNCRSAFHLPGSRQKPANPNTLAMPTRVIEVGSGTAVIESNDALSNWMIAGSVPSAKRTPNGVGRVGNPQALLA